MLLKRDKIGEAVVRRVCGREYIFPLGSYAYRELLTAEGQESVLGKIRVYTRAEGYFKLKEQQSVTRLDIAYFP